jgi:hypothetical protein
LELLKVHQADTLPVEVVVALILVAAVELELMAAAVEVVPQD